MKMEESALMAGECC